MFKLFISSNFFKQDYNMNNLILLTNLLLISINGEKIQKFQNYKLYFLIILVNGQPCSSIESCNNNCLIPNFKKCQEKCKYYFYYVYSKTVYSFFN